jgi:transcriptional regulator with XRE-family HTH domain
MPDRAAEDSGDGNPDSVLRWAPYATRFGIIGGMDAALLLAEARRRSGLSRRALACRGRTSASTLAAYEAGVSVPSVSTLTRLLRAAGFEPEVSLRPVPGEDRGDRAAVIESLLAFTDALPRSARGPLRYPPFGSCKRLAGR